MCFYAKVAEHCIVGITITATWLMEDSQIVVGQSRSFDVPVF